MSLTRVGGDILKKPLNIGAGVTISADGNIIASGVITATSFIGDISQATGAAAGLGTALSQTQSSPLNKVYYTNQVLSIGSTVTVNPPDSSRVAYTQYAEIAVEEGYDLIVEDGDDLVPDILGLSTATATPLSGAGGRVRADQFTNKAGTGAPTFTKGLQVTGVGTALLVTGDARVTGILTIGTSSVTLDGTNNQVNVGTGVTIHHTNGVQVGGNAVHSTGLTVNQINASGIVTATGGVVVGSSFIQNNAVGLGATTTTGRNAGVGTAVGTIIYNSTLKEVQIYKGDSFGWTNIASSYIEATGGTVSDYTSGSTIYRAHIFTSSGTFSVTTAPLTANTVEYLVVAGGGGGGGDIGGGGGAGGFRTGTGLPVSSSPGSYAVTVGAGGVGGAANQTRNTDPTTGQNGNDSIFSTISSAGGGGGGIYGGPGSPRKVGKNGGSGGGGGGGDSAPAAGGNGNTPATTPAQGTNGGTSNFAPGYGGGGGGGSGSVGSNAPSGAGGPGGNGTSSSITGITTTYAGGGGGSYYGGAGGTVGGVGGSGGGGNGGYGANATIPGPASGIPATFATGGGGGGGSWTGSAPQQGGSGGSGIVVVRYPIGNLTATAKATGGFISYSGGKTIHTFLSSGTFTVTNPSLTSVETLVIAGAGGGGDGLAGSHYGGGGGAGGLLYSSSLPISVTPGVYPISVGAGGRRSSDSSTSGTNGTPTSFSTLTSEGGGGGAGPTSAANGANGGSGGGGCYPGGSGGFGNRLVGTSTPTPAPLTPQGNNGAAYVSGGQGGGGGGAGGAGGPSVSPGPGVSYSISGTSITYSVGGVGSPADAGFPSSGIQNRGNGGAGGNPNEAGNSGGSGIVIISYPS